MPDIFLLVGFVSFVTGLWLAIGTPGTLIIAGGVVMGIGLLAAWRRNR